MVFIPYDWLGRLVLVQLVWLGQLERARLVALDNSTGLDTVPDWVRILSVSCLRSPRVVSFHMVETSLHA